jgi:type III secretion protein L
MKFFSILDSGKIVASTEKKVIPHEEFALLVSGEELIHEIKLKQELLEKEYDERVKALDLSGEEKGFQRGLEKWTAQLTNLDDQIKQAREAMSQAIVPIAMAAIKKIIGQELEERPEAIVDIVKNALKPVSQHRKINIFVNKSDLHKLEEERSRLKTGFDRLESLSITPREDVAPGGCIIETEVGIINANLDRQLAALEGAFKEFFSSGGGQ